MIEAKTVPAKYVFLDVVDFSHERSVEAQTHIVHSLNDIVKKSIDPNVVLTDRLILPPTGDGICIALLNIEDPFDIHVRLALEILRNLHEHNQSINNEANLPSRGRRVAKRNFEVRIGINANTDNLVIDINGYQNIAGRGINDAQRIMGKADGNQILIGQPVYDILRARESYMELLRSFPPTTTKHNELIRVYQLVDESKTGLNLEVPQALKRVEQEQPKTPEQRLHIRVAYYLAHAMKHRTFFIQNKDNRAGNMTPVILLWMLSGDSVFQFHSKGLTSFPRHTFRAGEGNFLEQFRFTIRWT